MRRFGSLPYFFWSMHILFFVERGGRNAARCVFPQISRLRHVKPPCIQRRPAGHRRDTTAGPPAITQGVAVPATPTPLPPQDAAILDFPRCRPFAGREADKRLSKTPVGKRQRFARRSVGDRQASARASAQQACVAQRFTLGTRLDYDDVHSSVRGHPATVLLPALFAAGTKHAAAARSICSTPTSSASKTMARLGPCTR